MEITSKNKVQVIEGEDAKATIYPDKVLLVPVGILKDNFLKKKMDNLKIFNQLTQDVPGLSHPKILKEGPGQRYEVERATGANITSMKGKTIGFGFVEFFHIPLEFKIQATLTYLRAIAAVNKKSYSFTDHKSHSVFIDPEKQRVMIVDAGSLDKVKDQEWAWEQDIIGGLKETLTSFFNKNSGTDDDDYMVPPGMTVIFDDLKNMKSANVAIKKIEEWIGGKDFAVSRKGDDKQDLMILVRAFGLEDKWTDKIQNADFENMTGYQRDLLEASLYRDGVLASGEPARLDKHVLGL